MRKTGLVGWAVLAVALLVPASPAQARPAPALAVHDGNASPGCASADPFDACEATDPSDIILRCIRNRPVEACVLLTVRVALCTIERVTGLPPDDCPRPPPP